MNNPPISKHSRRNLEPETIQDLQKCLYAWQKYNFGEQEPEMILLGVCEEIGELCHAQLKKEQDIRGDDQHHDREMIDAIGDIMLYLLNYMSMMGMEISPIVKRADVKPDPKNNARIRASVIASYKTVASILSTPKDKSRIQMLVSGLTFLCALKGWDLEKIIRITWKIVGSRDWKTYPETGRPPKKEENADVEESKPEEKGEDAEFQPSPVEKKERRFSSSEDEEDSAEEEVEEAAREEE